jgi:hypothetical protein
MLFACVRRVVACLTRPVFLGASTGLGKCLSMVTAGAAARLLIVVVAAWVCTGKRMLGALITSALEASVSIVSTGAGLRSRCSSIDAGAAGVNCTGDGTMAVETVPSVSAEVDSAEVDSCGAGRCMVFTTGSEPDRIMLPYVSAGR